MKLFRSLLVVSAVVLCAPPAPAQVTPQMAKPSLGNPRDRIDIVDHIERMKRIELTGDLGFPPLPPVYWDSPQDNLRFADRFPFGAEEASAADGDAPAPLDGFIPSGATGTGTAVPEIFKYLLPAGYETFDAELPPIPLVMAYHGYGASANSVATLSTIDEECYERGWAYFAPTGMDDQLFGSPLCLQNLEAALNWMLTNFNIDQDRIYAVGFSMGGGIMSNFAARHRNPNGTMIAALGIVSGTFDWTMSWKQGDQTLKTLMQSNFNFGGPANNATYKYNYQKASGLFYTYASYPPLVGTLEPTINNSLASNLRTTPTFIVWDTGDTLAEVQLQEIDFYNVVSGLGGTVEYHTTSGTIHPINGLPAPHSWAVLDENQLFDFFEGKVVDRNPSTFHALIAESSTVSWMSLEQLFTNTFSIADGTLDTMIPSVALSGVLNAKSVHLDMAALGITGSGPVRVNAGATAGNFALKLSGFEAPPAYMVDALTGDLVIGTESDPLEDSITQDIVSPDGGLDALVITDATWTTDLYTGPNPVPVGGALTLDIDAPAPSTLALLFIGFDSALGTIAGGYHITLQLGPPTIFVQLPLDLDGNASLPANMPNDPALSGLTMLMQTVAVAGGGGGVSSISNLWSLHVE